MNGSFGTYFFTRQAAEAQVAAVHAEKAMEVAQAQALKPYNNLLKLQELQAIKDKQTILFPSPTNATQDTPQPQ
jgi:hypothetical protein